MARRRSPVRTRPAPLASSEPAGPGTPPAAPPPLPAPARRDWILAAGLLTIHLALATHSLLLENPTVDEVAHLPAGISYWQTGTFKLYHHNPPLTRLAAALPVVLARPVTGPLYESTAWRGETPSQINFAQLFAALNADRYLDLFQLGRLVMPLFSVLGGLAVFLWSARLFGSSGGLLSLGLWCFCPNVLAHARLVTGDLAATALGVLATFSFWCYLRRPTARRAVVAGALLGLAQLAKFSSLILFGVWPVLWLAHELAAPRSALRDLLRRALGHGAIVVGTCLLVINLGYAFEGTGRPLGRYDFASASLTRPGVTPKRSPNPLLDIAWRHRVNRFRDTLLGAIPAPLPAHYLLGFDEQKLESEALPEIWFNPQADPAARTGYPVYLDGTLRRQGWRSYYLRTLLYKVPEGTWWLAVLALGVTIAAPRARRPLADELALAAVPVVTLVVMTFLTDINLGLRYVLPIFPYIYVAAGRLVPWCQAASTGRDRGGRLAAVGFGLVASVLATATIHPHYLAYFNRVSGGPSRGSTHLIDSNLDWGQDLVGLARWVQKYAPGERVGLAYFGQIHPTLMSGVSPIDPPAGRDRMAGLNWFLPPARPGTIERMPGPATVLEGPAPRYEPGLYAISASLLRGLPWRLNDPAPGALFPTWKTSENAFNDLAELTPIANVGYSIFLYRLDVEDAARLNSSREMRRETRPE